MPRIQLEDQDAVLVRLDMWPFPGVALTDVPKEKRQPIYEARKTLAHMAPAVRLPGVTAKKYRTTDIDRVIERSTA